MITKVSSASPHIVITGGDQFGPYISPGAYSAGMVRYHNNHLEVYDGLTWRELSVGPTTIGMSQQAEAALHWAMLQQQEHAELETLMKKHPGLQAAYEQFKLMKILVTEELKDTK